MTRTALTHRPAAGQQRPRRRRLCAAATARHQRRPCAAGRQAHPGAAASWHQPQPSDGALIDWQLQDSQGRTLSSGTVSDPPAARTAGARTRPRGGLVARSRLCAAPARQRRRHRPAPARRGPPDAAGLPRPASQRAHRHHHAQGRCLDASALRHRAETPAGASSPLGTDWRLPRGTDRRLTRRGASPFQAASLPRWKVNPEQARLAAPALGRHVDVSAIDLKRRSTLPPASASRATRVWPP